MNNNKLSIESQRRLTEALGECTRKAKMYYCDIINDFVCGSFDYYPNFNDGRVTVRLIALVHGMIRVWPSGHGTWKASVEADGMPFFDGRTQRGSSIEIAIAKAVDACLLAKEK